jgi:hypothetical protein
MLVKNPKIALNNIHKIGKTLDICINHMSLQIFVQFLKFKLLLDLIHTIWHHLILVTFNIKANAIIANLLVEWRVCLNFFLLYSCILLVVIINGVCCNCNNCWKHWISISFWWMTNTKSFCYYCNSIHCVLKCWILVWCLVIST